MSMMEEYLIGAANPYRPYDGRPGGNRHIVAQTCMTANDHSDPLGRSCFPPIRGNGPRVRRKTRVVLRL